MPERPLRLLIVGAHPDDADYHAGGTAAFYCAAGHVVKMVSLTNGDAGHQTLRGPELARRRKAEAAAAGAVIGATYDVFDNHDRQLLATLEDRGHARLPPIAVLRMAALQHQPSRRGSPRRSGTPPLVDGPGPRSFAQPGGPLPRFADSSFWDREGPTDRIRGSVRGL